MGKGTIVVVAVLQSSGRCLRVGKRVLARAPTVNAEMNSMIKALTHYRLLLDYTGSLCAFRSQATALVATRAGYVVDRHPPLRLASLEIGRFPAK